MRDHIQAFMLDLSFRPFPAQREFEGCTRGFCYCRHKRWLTHWASIAGTVCPFRTLLKRRVCLSTQVSRVHSADRINNPSLIHEQLSWPHLHIDSLKAPSRCAPSEHLDRRQTGAKTTAWCVGFKLRSCRLSYVQECEYLRVSSTQGGNVLLERVEMEGWR